MAADGPAWRLGARSETGLVRTANEDRMGWVRTAWGDVYVVSDGMGGYRGGALAAAITLATLQERLGVLDPASPGVADGVQAAFAAANDAVRAARDPEDAETRDMGATGVAVVVHGERARVAHVGDSRAYLWRRRGGLCRLTRDHTRVQALQDAGLLSAEQAAVHPDASVLERAIGHRPTVDADVGDWTPLLPGDLLLLCSDGLSGCVSDAEIAALLRHGDDPVALADRLVDCALGKGGDDNITVQLAAYRWPRRRGRWQAPAGRAALAAGAVGLTALLVASEAMRSRPPAADAAGAVRRDAGGTAILAAPTAAGGRRSGDAPASAPSVGPTSAPMPTTTAMATATATPRPAVSGDAPVRQPGATSVAPARPLGSTPWPAWPAWPAWPGTAAAASPVGRPPNVGAARPTLASSPARASMHAASASAAAAASSASSSPAPPTATAQPASTSPTAPSAPSAPAAPASAPRP